jgi:hypothetical protein
MSGPDEFFNLLHKESGASTDPTSHVSKGEMPGTDPTVNPDLPPSPTGSALAPAAKSIEWSMGEGAPTEKITFEYGQQSIARSEPGNGPVRPGDQVSLNPQPLPPGGADGTHTKSASGGGVNRGLLSAIIVVCLIGLIGGGVALVPQFFLSAGSQLTPGVIAWEGLGGNPGGGAGNGQRGPDVRASCKKTSSGGNKKEPSKSSGLEEHLIGGGFDAQSGSDPSVAVPDNSASRWDWRLHLAGGRWTSYAICLREPSAFFSSAHALDYISGPVEHFGSDAYQVTSEANCPSGEGILGGGYYALGGGTGGAQSDASSLPVSSSYPIVDGSGARWHVRVDQLSHSSSATLQAFAICSGTMTTHLEHTSMTVTAVESAAGHPPFSGTGVASCASGTLLSGGFEVTQGKDDSGLEVDIETNAPGKSLTGNKATGDTFTDWATTLNGVSHLANATSVTGETWVVCWDVSAQSPATETAQSTPAIQPTPTTQVGPTATPAGVSQPTPTATPVAQPTPTNTPAPQCQVVGRGSASNVNVDLSDINLDGAGPATQPNAVSHIRYSQTPVGGAIFSPVNASTLHDVGIGADYNTLDCARLRGFTDYSGASTAPDTPGEVFAVKTAGGHYAKVEIAAMPGGPTQVQWTTYNVS